MPNCMTCFLHPLTLFHARTSRASTFPRQAGKGRCRQAAIVLAVLTLMAATGCNGPPPVNDVAVQLYRANLELHQQVEAQGRVISTMGVALALVGGSLAITLAALWWRGGAISKTPLHEKPATNWPG